MTPKPFAVRPPKRRKGPASHLTFEERWALGYRGAPILECNLWLEEQMRRLADPRQYHHLYAEWLARYTAERGVIPVEPRRGFRAAAYGCLCRIAGLSPRPDA